MYLHLGQDTVIRDETIIGIFDMDNTTVSKHTRKFLSQAERSGRVTAVSYELPKSFVVCATDTERRVYLSQLSTATLKKRRKAPIEGEF